MDNKSYIENLISQSDNPEELSGVFSDHFDSITDPVSVSLGLFTETEKVDDIVGMLRTNGINARPFYDPKVKEDLSSFVVDGTGVRSPFMSPEDAVKATADLFEIMQENKVQTSRALPVMKENLITAVSRVYEGKMIDVARNNPKERHVNNFLSEMLKHALSEMENVDVNVAKGQNDKVNLFRGGTLGDNPYALTFHRRKRDAAYATKDFSIAATYADGVKGAGLRYPEIDGHSYGFIYQFAESPGQRYYSMAGVENPRGSKECVDHPENRDDYETLILKGRNPLKAIYLKVDDKVVQIADEKGFMSKDWNKFAGLHKPYNVNEKNDYMVERFNRQISEFPVVPYTKSNSAMKNDRLYAHPKIQDFVFGSAIRQVSEPGGKYQYQINNAEFSTVNLPENFGGICFKGDFNLENCSLPKTLETLDLSKCTGIVGLSNCDLSTIKNIVLPEQCDVFFLSNVKLPKDGTLDFSKMKYNGLSFENQDLSDLAELKFPENAEVKVKDGTKFPDGIKIDFIDNKKKLAQVRKKAKANGGKPGKPPYSVDLDALRGISQPDQAKAGKRPSAPRSMDLNRLKYLKGLSGGRT